MSIHGSKWDTTSNLQKSSLLAAAKSVRAVLWTDKNSENRKVEYGVLIL